MWCYISNHQLVISQCRYHISDPFLPPLRWPSTSDNALANSQSVSQSAANIRHTGDRLVSIKPHNHTPSVHPNPSLPSAVS